MDAIVIKGGKRLKGEVKISGAKNAALPLIASAILTGGRNAFKNVPDLHDVRTMAKVLSVMGAEVSGRRTLKIASSSINRLEAPYELVRTMRASVLVLGPLLSRYGRARVSLPGGCAIGARPIDQHLKGLEAMGAQIELNHGYVEARCKRLHGANIVCDIATVTGTMNLMMAASLAKGMTTIENAAREPEVEELARVLNKMGAKIYGAGTASITIEGVDDLHPVEHAIIADRIEAGTFMVAAAVTGGNLLVKGCLPEHLDAVINKLVQVGVEVKPDSGGIRVKGHGKQLNPVDITTQPYPGFPTDMQAQFMVLAALTNGQSILSETIFENRFMHVPELCRMNADIQVQARTAIVRGPAKFMGTVVMASDLRASAALVLAGLVAQGTTRIRRVYHLDRGYERIELKLRKLGANIRRVKE